MGELWTIGRIVKWSEQYFAAHGVETPRLDAEVLLAHLLGENRLYLYVHYDKPLNPTELEAYRDFVRRRAAREPIAYITGTREFMGLSFTVTPEVLVPQPDTETLVSAAKERLKGRGAAHTADLGTGSGAIALSLLHLLPEISAVATDLSPAALKVAEENAARLNLAARVVFYHGDLFAPLTGQTFDAILSNPPYIPRGDIEGLPPEVLAEPRLALDGGADGLDFYRRIVREARTFLRPGGFLALEAGQGEAAAILALAEEYGWGQEEIVKDLAGIERVVVLARDRHDG